MKELTLKSGKTISLNQAFNMDCLEFMKELPDKCIDLVLTDPPYGINRSGQNQSYPNKKNTRHGGKKYFEDKQWDNKAPSKEIFKEIFRVSENQIIWGGNYFSENLPAKMCWLVWDKDQRGMNSDGELAFTSFDSALKIYTKNRGILAKDKTIHPTQKPKDLFRWCLSKYTKENQIIFDPFLGSFTTAIASENLNLNWLGCEKDPDYFKSGYHRYEQETKQMLMEF